MSNRVISESRVLRLAHLARVHLDDAEVVAMSRDLTCLLEPMDVLFRVVFNESLESETASLETHQDEPRHGDGNPSAIADAHLRDSQHDRRT